MMRQLWRDILTHRLIAILFVVCWAGIWVISAITLPEAVGIRQFLLACVASGIVGWWRMPDTAVSIQAHMNDSIRYGLVVAVILMEISLVMIWIMEQLSAPAIETTTGTPWWGAVAAGIAFFLGFGIIAGAAGMIGGIIGGALAYTVHRRRRRGGPATPTGVS